MKEFIKVRSNKLPTTKKELLEDERLWSLDDYIAQLVIKYCDGVINGSLGETDDEDRLKKLRKISRGLKIKYHRPDNGYSKYEAETNQEKREILDKKFKEAMQLFAENFEGLWW